MTELLLIALNTVWTQGTDPPVLDITAYRYDLKKKLWGSKQEGRKTIAPLSIAGR